MKFQKLLVVSALLVLTSLSAQESNAPLFGKGLFNLVGKDSTFTMKVGLRMQFLSVSNWPEGGDYESSMLIRRSRLKFDGYAFSPKLKYKIELGLSNRDQSGILEYTSNTPRMIMDAVMMYNFAGNWVLWVGQTKLPGNRERVISSANMQQVDRSILNRRFNIDRDIGIQLRNHHTIGSKFIVREIVAISQGEGRNVTAGNKGGHQYTGRIELLPFGNFKGKGDYVASDLSREATPKLSLAATYDFNNDAVRTRSNQGAYMQTDTGFYETDISTLFIDAMFKYKGFSFMGEYADREADDPIAKNSDGTETGDIVQVGNGLNLQTGYVFPSNWEVSGRYSTIDLDKNITGKGVERQYTLGLSRYIVGHKLKVQTDVSYLNSEFSSNDWMWRIQVDMHF